MFLLQIISLTALLFAVPSLVYLLGRCFAPRLCRRIAYETHLWLGIVSGLILFVVCLSGTLLTFKTETIRFVEKDRYYVTVPENQSRKTLEELVPAIEKELDGKVVRVTIPDEVDRSWVFNVRKNERKNNTAGEKPKGPPAGMPATHAMLGTAYLVDPYTGDSLGPQRSSTYMFFLMLQMLHRFLLLPISIGQPVVGTATLVFIVLIVGGLFLWLPAKLSNRKGWTLGLKVRRGKSWNRFLYDTHNTLGFYSLIPLMVMALTGPVISFAWYRDAAGKVLGTKPFEKAFEKPMMSSFTGIETQNLTWDDFLVKAAPHFPRPGFTQIYLPQNSKSGVTVRKTGEGFCTIGVTDKIQFDRYTGEVLKADSFDGFSFGEKVSTLIFQLHNGEIFGTVSKIVYFVTCLIATCLPLTGVILWIGKLRTRRRTRKQKATTAQELAVVSRHGSVETDKISEPAPSVPGTPL